MKKYIQWKYRWSRLLEVKSGILSSQVKDAGLEKKLRDQILQRDARKAFETYTKSIKETGQKQDEVTKFKTNAIEEVHLTIF